MAMENGPVEDVFPIENGEFSIAMLVHWRVISNPPFYREVAGIPPTFTRVISGIDLIDG